MGEIALSRLCWCRSKLMVVRGFFWVFGLDCGFVLW